MLELKGIGRTHPFRRARGFAAKFYARRPFLPHGLRESPDQMPLV